MFLGATISLNITIIMNSINDHCINKNVLEWSFEGSVDSREENAVLLY